MMERKWWCKSKIFQTRSPRWAPRGTASVFLFKSAFFIFLRSGEKDSLTHYDQYPPKGTQMLHR